jgi:DNA-binding transcriptional regulator YiaG
LVGRSARRRAVLLDRALALGLVHIAPAWGRRTRQKLDGVYPGPRPQEEQPMVQVADLREARERAGWSQQTVATRLGVARTTVEHWERRCAEPDREHVPGWASAAAAAALEEARQVAAERIGRPSRSDRILELIGQQPGLSEKALAKALSYERQDRIADDVHQLEEQQLIHRRHAGQHGQQTGLYPGPLQDDVLTPEELRELRTSRGLRQRELAERYGTHVQAVRDWESGRRPMSLEHQQALRALLEDLEPVGTPPRLLQLRERLAQEVERHAGRTRRQLDLVVTEEQLGSRAEVDAALTDLVEDQVVHEGRIGAGIVGRAGRITAGRAGYLPGPTPQA